MNKQEFMQLLEQRIKLLPLSERHRLINFYNEALEDRIEEGMSEEDARALIVSGFADNVSKELPLEYAVEMNNLIRLEMNGSIG